MSPLSLDVLSPFGFHRLTCRRKSGDGSGRDRHLRVRILWDVYLPGSTGRWVEKPVRSSNEGKREGVVPYLQTKSRHSMSSASLDKLPGVDDHPGWVTRHKRGRRPGTDGRTVLAPHPESRL